MGSSAHSNLTNRSAKSLTLQRFLPFGGSEQARAIKCASCSPSSLLGLVFFGWRWTRAASKPSQTNLSRTRKTLERLTSRASAILVSGQAGLSAASWALRRMRAWVSSGAPGRGRLRSNPPACLDPRRSRARGCSSCSACKGLLLFAAARPPARMDTVRIDEGGYCGKPIMSKY
jgi:hypothetical protein